MNMTEGMCGRNRNVATPHHTANNLYIYCTHLLVKRKLLTPSVKSSVFNIFNSMAEALPPPQLLIHFDLRKTAPDSPYRSSTPF